MDDNAKLSPQDGAPVGARERMRTTLLNDGYDMPDSATFAKDMMDPGKRERMRTTLLNDGYDMPDSATFAKDMMDGTSSFQQPQRSTTTPPAAFFGGRGAIAGGLATPQDMPRGASSPPPQPSLPNAPQATAPDAGGQRSKAAPPKAPGMLLFERRWLDNKAPSLQNEDGTRSTHKMAWAEVDGKYIAYPTIVQATKGLQPLSDDAAVDYALKTGEYRQFDTANEAAAYADGGYKEQVPRERKERLRKAAPDIVPGYYAALDEKDKAMEEWRALRDLQRSGATSSGGENLNALMSAALQRADRADNSMKVFEEDENAIRADELDRTANENFDRLTKETDVPGVRVSDPYKIENAVRALMEKNGSSSNAYHDRLVHELTAKVDSKQVVDDMLERARKKTEPIMAEAGKKFREGFVADKKIRAQAQAQMEAQNTMAKSMAAEREQSLVGIAKEEGVALQQKYGQQATEIEAQYRDGAMSLDDANSAIAQLNTQYQQEAMVVQERLQRRYAEDAARFNRQFLNTQKAIIDNANDRIQKELDAYNRNAGETDPELVAKVNSAYEEAYKEAVAKREGLVGAAASLRFWNDAMANPGGAMLVRMGEGFVKNLGGTLRTMGGFDGQSALYRLGADMESAYLLPESHAKKFTDLLDGANFAQLTGELAGGMAPSLVAGGVVATATAGAGAAPVATLLASGIASYATEGLQNSMDVRDQVMRQTGDERKATEAAYKTFGAHLDTWYLGLLDGLPFVGKVLDRIPTKALRMGAGGVAETAMESVQEVTQDESMANIIAGREAWDTGIAGVSATDRILDADRLGEMAVTMAPLTLFGMGGQLREGGVKAMAADKVRQMATDGIIASSVNNARTQWVNGLIASKGEKYADAVVGALYNGGYIDVATAESIRQDAAKVQVARQEAQRAGVPDARTSDYVALRTKYMDMLSRAEQEQEGPVKAALIQKAKAQEAIITSMLTGEDADYVKVTLPSGGSVVMDMEEATAFMADPKKMMSLVLSQTADKNATFEGFGKKGMVIAEKYGQALERFSNDVQQAREWYTAPQRRAMMDRQRRERKYREFKAEAAAREEQAQQERDQRTEVYKEGQRSKQEVAAQENERRGVPEAVINDYVNSLTVGTADAIEDAMGQKKEPGVVLPVSVRIRQAREAVRELNRVYNALKEKYKNNPAAQGVLDAISTDLYRVQQHRKALKEQSTVPESTPQQEARQELETKAVDAISGGNGKETVGASSTQAEEGGAVTPEAPKNTTDEERQTKQAAAPENTGSEAGIQPAPEPAAEEPVATDLTPEEEVIVKESNITPDEAKRAKRGSPKRTRKHRAVVEAVESQAADAETASDAAGAAESIAAAEAAEVAILSGKDDDATFSDKYGVDEAEIAKELNDAPTHTLESAYKQLTGKELGDEEATRQFAGDFLSALAKQGISLKVKSKVSTRLGGVTTVRFEPQVPKKPRALVDIAMSVAKVDKLRPVLESVHIDGDMMVSTDAHKMVVVPRPSDEELAKRIVDARYARLKKIAPDFTRSQAQKTIDEDLAGGLNGKTLNLRTGEVISEQYPNYKAVIPRSSANNVVVPIDKFAAQVDGAARALSNVAKDDVSAIAFDVKTDGNTTRIYIKPEMIVPVVEALRAAGNKTVSIEASAANRAMVLYGDKVGMGLSMPMLVEDGSSAAVTSPIVLEMTPKEEASDIVKATRTEKAPTKKQAAAQQTSIDQAPAKSPLKSSGVYYHYSNGDFDKFISEGEEGYVKAHTLTGHGIYFLAGKPQMKYGKNEYKVHLDIKNPFFVQGARRMFAHPLSGEQVNIEKLSKEDIDGLRKAGYDAIVHNTQTVVFDGSQVAILEKNGIKQPAADQAPDTAAQQTSIEYDQTSLADAIRKAKINPKKGDIHSFIIPPQLWNAAVEVVALAIEAGEALAKAISAGIKHIRQSEWYQEKATTEERKLAEQQFSEALKALSTPTEEESAGDGKKSGPSKTAKQVNAATGVSRKRRHQKVDEREAVRQRIRDMAKAARDAVSAMRDARKAFAEEVKSMMADLKGRITTKQAASITTAAANVDPMRPRQVERFAMRAARLIERVEYAQDMADARKAQQAAKTISKRKTIAINHRDILREAAKVNPANIEDPGAYADLVGRYIKGITDLTTPIEEQVSFAELEKAIDGWLKEQEEAVRDEDAAVAMIEASDRGAAVENASAVLASDDPAAAMADVPEEERESTEDVLRSIAKDRSEQIRTLDAAELMTDDADVDRIISSLITGIQEVNDRTIDLMSGYQAAIYIRAANNVLVNQSVAGIGPAIAMGRALNALGGTTAQVRSTPAASVPGADGSIPKPTRNALQIAEAMGPRARRWFSPRVAQATTSVGDMFQFYLGWKNELGEIQRLIGVGEYVRGKQKWNNERKRINEEAAKFYRSLRSKYGAKSDGAQSMAAEGLAAFVTQQMPGLSEQESFDARKKIVLEDIGRKAETRRDKKQAEIAQKVYDRIIAPATDRKQVLSNLKRDFPAAHESLAYLMGMFKPYNATVRANLYATWNQSHWTNDPFYLPVLTTRAANATTTLDPSATPSFSHGQTLKPAQPGSMKARRQYRSLGKDRTISYNIRGGSVQRLSEQLYDAYTTPARMRIAEFFRAPDAKAVFRSDENHKFVKDRMGAWLDAQDAEAETLWHNQVMDALAENVRRIGNVLALGGFLQLPKQYSEALVSASTMLGPHRFARNIFIPNAAFALLNQYAIGSRHNAIKGGTQFRRRLEELDNDLLLALRSGSKERIAAAHQKVQDFWMASLSKGDVAAAYTTWLAAYEKRREEQGHKVTLWEDEANYQEIDPEREEAALYAETMTDRLYVSSDPAKMAAVSSKAVGPNSGPANLFRAAAFAFTSFVAQATSRGYIDAADVLFGPRDRKALALLGVGSRLASTATFAGVSLYLVNGLVIPAIGGLMGAIADAIGDDDEEDKEAIVAFTSVMVGLHILGLMDADLTRAAFRAQTNKLRGPKDPDVEREKRYRRWYTRIITDYLGVGLFPMGDVAMVDGINYAQYLRLLEQQDPSVYTQSGEPMKFSSWQRQEQSWLVRPGQGWPAGEPGLYGVFGNAAKDASKQWDLLTGNLPGESKQETPEMKAKKEEVKGENMLVKSLVGSYKPDMGAVQEKAWETRVESELKAAVGDDPKKYTRLFDRVVEGRKRARMSPEILAVYNLRSNEQRAIAILDLFDAAATEKEVDDINTKLTEAGLASKDLMRALAMEAKRRKEGGAK